MYTPHVYTHDYVRQSLATAVAKHTKYTMTIVASRMMRLVFDVGDTFFVAMSVVGVCIGLFGS